MLVVYTTLSCKYCRLLLDILNEHREAHYEVQCMDEFQFLEAQRLSGKRTLPQLMCGDVYVGGYRDIAELAEKGVLKETLSEIRSKALHKTFELPAGATRLRLPESPRDDVCGNEAVGDPNFTSTAHLYWECRNGATWDFRSYGYPGEKRRIRIADVFRGIRMVAADLSADEMIEKVAEMIEQGYFNFADKKLRIRMRHSEEICAQVVRSQPEQILSCVGLRQSSTLNLHRPYRGRVVDSAPRIAQRIQVSMSRLYDRFVTKDGVSYFALRTSPEYRAYLEQTIELQRCDLSTLDDSERKAFFLNVYNAMVVHANVVFGPPTNPIQRKRFFGRVGYEIGGLKWSMDDIEHGALRCNPPSGPFGRRRFKDGDPRLQFVLKTLDPRIHFALVCGAKSCPPVQVYNARIIDKALQWATEGFLEEDVKVNAERNTVTISKIMYWYQRDFGATPRQLLQWIAQFISEAHPLHTQLSRAPTITYAKYDWSLNNRDLDDEVGLTTDESEIAAISDDSASESYELLLGSPRQSLDSV